MKFTTSPAYSFTTSKKLTPSGEDPLITPSPQNYSPNKLTLRHPTPIIGSSKRFPPNTQPCPGPGAYNIPPLFPKGFKYSIGKSLLFKNKNLNKLITPGPGTYRTLTKSKSCFYTFGLKLKEPRKDKSPGPGDYSLRSKRDLIKSSYIFGREKRFDSLITTFNRLTPGPGKYKYSKDAIKIRNPKYSFGKEERKISDGNKLNPGPGSYNHKEYVGKEGQKISISNKFKQRYLDMNDVGPGQYNHTDLNFYKVKSPAYKIGRTKRFQLLSSKDTESSPGPGNYNHIKSTTLTKKNEPRWKIGTAKRRPIVDLDKYVPGVGEYNLSRKTGKDSPQYTIRLKTKIIKDSLNTPGPGKYHTEKANIYIHNPSWKIGTEKKLKTLDFIKNTPGVGSYTINSSRNFRPKFGYTKQKRGYLSINNYPGPGAYHIPCSFEELNTYTRIQGKFNDEFRFI